MEKTILFLTAAVLLFSCSPALADEGQDYGYWCTECGVQHGPGESCPRGSSSGSSSQDEPYDFEKEKVYPATPVPTTVKSFGQAAL